MNIPAFLVYCAIMAVTPGPNNLMSLYLGASGGSRFWRFFAGSIAGLFVKCALWCRLNGPLAEKIPALVPYLKWLGALYMLYLAFGMVRSGLKPAGDDQRSGEGSFQSGILLQALNVKSWAAALSIFSVYIIPFTTAVGAMLLAAGTGSVPPLFKGEVLPDGGHGDGHCHNDGRNQLHGGGGHVEPQRHRHDKAVQAAAEHHAQNAAQHGALAHQRLADDEGSQCNGHHAGAHVDITAFLVLCQQPAGQRTQRPGYGQTHRDGNGGVDAGSPHPGGIIAGGADGKPQPRAQKAQHRRAGDGNDNCRQHQLVPAAQKAQRSFCHGEDGRGLDQ